MATPNLSLPIIIIIFILSTFTLHLAQSASHHHAAAPSPSSVDCSNLVMNMADCLSFVSNGSTVQKPEKTCCSGLKTVLKTDAQCLCEAFKSSASLGVVLNVSKAMSLPAACKMSNVAAPRCGLSLTPGMGPAMSPALSPAMAPTMVSGGNAMAPAPTPGSSGSYKLDFSIASLIFGLMVVVIASSSSSF